MVKSKKVKTAKGLQNTNIEIDDGPSTGKGKKVAPMPDYMKKNKSKNVKDAKDPLIQPRPKNFGIGQCIQPKRDLYRFVKWPRYIILQRKKAILKKRLRLPPPINQFNQKLDKPTTKQLFELCKKYRPLTKHARKTLLKVRAQKKVEGKVDKPSTSRIAVKNGIREVTQAVMKKTAKLVLIASDVDPVEIVIFLPALCRKMGIPYCIVNNKAKLGSIVRRKNTTCICFTKFRDEDKSKYSKIIDAVNTNYNSRYEEIRKHWGGGVLSQKSMARIQKLEKAKSKEVGVN